MIDPATFFLPIRALAEQLRTKKLTSVDLTTACLDRLEKLGPKLQRGRQR